VHQVGYAPDNLGGWKERRGLGAANYRVDLSPEARPAAGHAQRTARGSCPRHHRAVERTRGESAQHRPDSGSDDEDRLWCAAAVAYRGTPGVRGRGPPGTSSSRHGDVPQTTDGGGGDGPAAMGLGVLPLEPSTAFGLAAAAHRGAPECPLGGRTAALPRLRMAARQADHATLGRPGGEKSRPLGA
jgi:hypothetical protein